jgi:hypothetical protein
MACKKYTITNTGSTATIYFEYRRCGDGLQMDQVPLNYNQTKNIWFLDGTFEIDQNSALLCSIVDDGAFPVSPSNTPTQTPTPSVTVGLTPTATQTPTQTPTNTQTQTPTNTNTQTQTPTNTNTPTDNVTDTPTPTPTQTPTPSVTSTGTQTPTPTTTQTQTPTTTTTLTASETVTPTTTQTQTPTDTPEVSPTTTPTNTSTPTQTGTPAVTPTTTTTPTASSFGTNTFRVEIVNTGRARDNSYSLTEIPYDTIAGSGFTATTGTFPITAGQTVYGTHQAFSSSVNNYITFEMTCVIDGELSIVAFLNGGFVRSQGPYNLSSSGPNTITFYFPVTVLVTDTLRFQLS